MTKKEALDFIIDHTHPMCETMKDLEALDFSYNILQELIDKATPKKVAREECGQYIASCVGKCECGEFLQRSDKYCCGCGQALDWSKDE